MLSHNLKRYLSLFLSFLMVFSLMPVSALAADVETHDHSHDVIEEAADTQNAIVTEEPETNVSSAEPNPEIVRFQEMIDEILATYAGSAALTVEEVKAAAEALSDESCEEAWYEIMVLEEEMNFAYDDALVNEAELEALVSANLTMDAFIGVITSKVVAPSVSFFATTVSPIEGVSVTDSSSTGSLSNGTVTITVKGGWFSSSRNTNTITVANTSGKPGKLSFDYSLTNHYGTTLPSAQGSYLSDMTADGSYEFTITSKGSSSTATLTLSNFQFKEAQATSTVTVEYNSTLGSVTAAGAAVNSEDTIADVSITDGVALVATPNGSAFLGWVNKGTHEILSTSTTFTYKPIEDSTVVAAFAKASSKPWFKVGTKLYDDLTEACESGGTVVLAHDGTLPAGDHTVASGATLLIPYDDANTLCTTKPTVVTSGTTFISLTTESWAKPTAYRTLNMASGANIIINGAMSISGKSAAQQVHNGCPSRSVGFVNMASGSTIAVNNGANLYAWGYITGSGSVTVNSGGTVYENFQVKDWRGGTAASGMIDQEQKVFPVSQYYVQNIEVPMTLYSGALEYCHMGLVASKVYGETLVPFIGGTGMFRIGDGGSITKDYIEETDRLCVDVDGSLTMSSLNLEVSSYKMNSANYVLPITNNLTVRVNSGTTAISQDMCMLPGSEIIVGENATVELASGVNLYVYDSDEWNGKKFVYSARDVSPLAYVGCKKAAPVSRSLTDAKIVVNGTLDASAGFLYTTTGGANITSNGGGQIVTGTAGTATITYQATQSGTDITFENISITPAKLLNQDTTYQNTTTANITYTYTDGKWICDAEVNEHKYENNVCTICGYEKGCEHSYTSEVTKEATCNEAGIKTYTCSNCGHSYTEEIEKLTTHTPNEDDGDCTTAITCSVCGTETTPAETSHTGGSATCEVLAVCTRCGKSYGSLADHTPGSAATCTDAQTCTVCGNVITAALDHDFTGAWQKNETNHWKKCSRCDATDQKAAHSYGEPQFTWSGYACTAKVVCSCGDEQGIEVSVTSAVTTEATCTVKGVKTYTATAVWNEQTYTAAEHPTEDLGLDSNNHVNTKEEAQVDATCTEVGYTAGVYCEDCKKWISGHEEIPANGHSYGEPIFTWNGYACTAKVVCSCGDEQGIEVSVTSAVTTEATCTVKGVKTYTATAVWNEQTYTAAEHPTEDLGLDSNNHVNTKEEAQVDATCTEVGYTAGVYCEDCKKWISGHEEIPANGHSYGEPIFTWNGYACTAKVVCSCGDEQGIEVSVTSAVTTEATCTVKGVKTYTATAVWNEQTYTAAEHPTEDLGLDSNNHVNTKEEAQVDATCTEVGYTAGVYCEDCKKWISGHEEIEAKDHTDMNPADHICDACKVELGDCIDTNPKDNVCDICGENMEAVVSYNVINKTNGTATYSINGTTLNVQNELACIVLAAHADGTYTPLDATENSVEGYDFNLSTIKSGESIVIAVKGDINNDGRLNTRDQRCLDYLTANESHPQHMTLDDVIQQFNLNLNADILMLIADLDCNGKLNTRDQRYMDYATANDSFYIALEWDISKN